ncbi:hypothetical protein ACLSY8_07900 [Avibacterium avium]|uniref:hypothetical protein n=4 Tax=Avibacterium avium TaxID=751 RepID=UPI0039FBCC1E
MNLKYEIEITRNTYCKEEHIFKRLKYKLEQGEFIGNYAKYDLTDIIYAYSVGFKNIYKQFLERTVNWLKQGVEKKEDFGEFDYHQYELTSALAIATWLDTGVNNIELWKNSLKWQDKLYGKENYSKGMSLIEQEIFALQLLHYIQAQEYEKAIQLYQLVKGDKPLKLHNNMSGYRIAYAYCLHFHEQKFTVEQLEKSSKSFLEKHLQMLYTKGRPTEMLYWLKMVCDAREKEYTPEEVIYTFYEYIPEEEYPEFVKDLLKGKPTEKKSFFSRFFRW